METTRKNAILRFLRPTMRNPRSLHDAPDGAWRRDPLSHPVLRIMSERELADLPFDPHRITPD
jgi:hypothetical protein